VLFSIAGAATCGTAGSWVLAAGLAEPLLGLIPLDPFITMGLMAFSSATLGWLLGPSLGSGVFNLWHRSIRPQMASVRSMILLCRGEAF
jgi:import inner membrane translocase subunit TIM23